MTCEIKTGEEAWIEVHTPPDVRGLSIEPDGAPMDIAESEGCQALLWGTLYDRDDLAAYTGTTSHVSDARLALSAYLRLGESCFSRLRGVFALVIRDTRNHLVLAARDHLGVHPLFYARKGDGFVLSPCIHAMLRHSGVSAELNRPALAEYLMHRWPMPEETFFASVKRVPSASFLRIASSGSRIERYWDPLPPGRAIRWLREDDLPQFDHLLLKAVRRCLSIGPPSIFLSGGLDSVSIAVIAAAECDRAGMRRPLALSLDFPMESEEALQRAIAGELGLEQVLLKFTDAVGPQGWLVSALDVSRKWPTPLLNGWMPAYLTLGAYARNSGRASILTGVGGDEWLGVAPLLAADYLRDLNIRGWWRLLASERQSMRIPLIRSLRNMAWSYGFRPILVDVLRAAPGGSRAFRTASALRDCVHPPLLPWVAPDPTLRAELSLRREAAQEAVEAIRRGFKSYYFRHCRSYAEALLPSWVNEEYHAQGVHLGARILHPFLDPDLVDFLYRVPPGLLNKGGRSKAFLRESLDRQFPGLGFKRQRKYWALNCGTTLILQEGPQALKHTGGTPALAQLGIVDRDGAEAALRSILATSNASKTVLFRRVLSIESWVAGNIN